MSKGKIPCDAGGTVERPYPAYAWPGGYPILYYFSDGETCCAQCANRANGSCATASPRERESGWRLVGASVFYEGPAETCSHCGAVVESAYGDPAADATAVQS